MSHLLYIIVGFLFGGLIGVIMTAIYLTDRYTRKGQQEEILYVINKIKRLKRFKKIPVIKKVIGIFACRCVHFDPESFRAFPGKEFENIAKAISLYANQDYLGSYYEDNQASYPVVPLTYVTEEETKMKICENLQQAFAV